MELCLPLRPGFRIAKPRRVATLERFQKQLRGGGFLVRSQNPRHETFGKGEGNRKRERGDSLRRAEDDEFGEAFPGRKILGMRRMLIFPIQKFRRERGKRSAARRQLRRLSLPSRATGAHRRAPRPGRARY